VKDRIREVVREKLGDGLELVLPEGVRRDAVSTRMAGKARAVIGMRRAGKTYFLFQCLAQRLAEGWARDRLVYFNFEDERLAEMQAADLALVIEEYYRRFPDYRRACTVGWFFDEIQVIPGWESFVRRLLDTENVEVFLSGSSERLLSRELATSMRGRALETVIRPYSFREFLRARGREPKPGARLLSGTARSRLQADWDAYLTIGGFPEAQAATDLRERVELLQGYIDVVILRDVGERHHVGNLVALRAFVRHLIAHPARSLSINRLYGDFRSRGVPVAKGTLLEWLAHLEDAFLVFTVGMATTSERKRQTNPRKLYLADPSLALAHTGLAGEDRGWRIENVVAVELARRCRDLGYVRTDSGREVDFLATGYAGERQLIQVAADLSAPSTFEREVSALLEAAAIHREAELLLLTETAPPHGISIPAPIQLIPVWEWLLGEGPGLHE
jgi:uncharacterized protein